MKKIMSLILALTMILSVGSMVASAAATEVTNNVETDAPVNYATAEYGATVMSMYNGSANYDRVFLDDSILDGAMTAGCIKNSIWETTNSWIAIDLGAERKVSAIVIDQWKDRIKNYEVYATTDSDIYAEISSLPATSRALPGAGEWYKELGNNNLVSYTEGPLDDLKAENALVASGTLAGEDTETNTKNTIQFSAEKNARYIIIVLRDSYAKSSGFMIDYIKVLGTTESNSIDFNQYPKTYVNYADKSEYPGVSAIRTNTIDEKANGKADTLVNPNSTAISSSFSLPLTVIPSFQKSGTTLNNNSWFGIDLGTERTFDTVNIYQYKNRMKTVSVYSATAEQFANAAKDDKELDQAIIDGLTLLKKNVNLSTAGGTSDAPLNNSKTELTTPSTVNLGNEKQARYLIFLVEDAYDKFKGMPVFEVHVMGKKASLQQTNAYPDGGLDYIVKFVNDRAIAKRYAIVEAQYNEAGEMIANNIKYVNIDPLYAKSFAGEIEKVDTAKQIKVFLWCLDELKPLETEYTFNVQ